MAKRLKADVESTVSKYLENKTNTGSLDSSVGFIRKNRLSGKTKTEINRMLSVSKKLHNGTIKGEGDLFKEWCTSLGRPIPSDPLISLMNKDPDNAKRYIHDSISENPLIHKAYSSYTAGRGRKRV